MRGKFNWEKMKGDNLIVINFHFLGEDYIERYNSDQITNLNKHYGSSEIAVQMFKDILNNLHDLDRNVETNDMVQMTKAMLKEWYYRLDQLSRQVTIINDWAQDLWLWALPKVWFDDYPIDTDLDETPPVLVQFEWWTLRDFGRYQPNISDIRFRSETSSQPRSRFHLKSYSLDQQSEIEVAADVLHELIHFFEYLAWREGLLEEVTHRSHNYHSPWFRWAASELGIPCTVYGRSLGIRNPSQFLEWSRKRDMKERTTAFGETKYFRRPNRVEGGRSFGVL